MTPLLHAFNTGTLAAWLSLVGAGVTGLLLPDWVEPLPSAVPAAITEWTQPEIILDPGSMPEDPVPPEPAATPEELPAPPEMPALAEMEPLPEIPELPEPPPPTPTAKPTLTAPKPSPNTARNPSPTRPATTATANRAISGGSQRPTAAAGSGQSDAARLAAGRMPSPSYPAESQRKGQTGTVLVEFTVDSSGRVIAAYAKSPSPWPLLNDEAVRTVRRWRFPPGGTMKLQRPIVFQLK